MSDIKVNGICPACRCESLVLLMGGGDKAGNIICKRKKGERPGTCPDPDQITRIIDMARWIDNSSGGEEDVYRATVRFPDDWTLGQVKSFGKMLDDVDRVRYIARLADSEVVIQIHPPHRLSHDYIPSGSHEFARGWGVRHTMSVVAMVLGMPLVWRQYRINTRNPWRDLRESKETITV